MSYEQIVPDTLVLTRDPPDSGFCPRSWDIAYIEIDEDHNVNLRTRTHYSPNDGVHQASRG